MAQQPPIEGRPIYRVLVKASESVSRRFVWEIVTNVVASPAVVRRSSATYRTMEEAYSHGSDALKRLHSP